MYLGVIILMVMGLLLFQTLADTPYAAVNWLARIYFVLLFIYLSWWLGIQAVVRSAKLEGDEAKALRRSLRVPFALALAPVYIGAYLYAREYLAI